MKNISRFWVRFLVTHKLAADKSRKGLKRLHRVRDRVRHYFNVRKFAIKRNYKTHFLYFFVRTPYNFINKVVVCERECHMIVLTKKGKTKTFFKTKYLAFSAGKKKAKQFAQKKSNNNFNL